ncbi:MAG: hypothetical protein ACLUOI_36955 [Eisenbergiella sp.]
MAVSFKLCEEAEDNNAELSGLPVLVVDDDQVICESAAEILDDLGMRSNKIFSGKKPFAALWKPMRRRATSSPLFWTGRCLEWTDWKRSR